MSIIKRITLVGTMALLALSPFELLYAARISQLNVENRNDFVLEPGKIEVFLNPGETTTRTISIINRINRKVEFNVTTEDFIGTDDLNNPVKLLGGEKSPYSFKDNLVPEETSFQLGFGQKIELPITISVPKDAQPGGYYSSVIISGLPTIGSADTGGGAKIVSRVAALFFVRVNGPVNQVGHLDDFRVKGGKNFMQKGPVDFEILFKNEGTVHLVPYGTVTVRNIFNKEVGTVPVDAYFSLPKSLRYRLVTWNNSRLFGRYTAELNLNRGYEGNEDTMKLVFWVIPLRYIGIVVIALLILTLIWKFISSRFEFRRKVN